MTGLALMVCLSGCSTVRGIFGGHKEEAAPGKTRTAEGAEPKFAQPKYTGEGAPDLASVPATTPTMPSTKQEKEKVIEGLLADRDRAHYTDQDSRVAPIDVRPLTAAQAEAEPAAPPQAKGAPVQPVTKLQTLAQNAPAATPDELAAKADLPPPPPPPPDEAGRRLPFASTGAAIGPAAPAGQKSAGPRAVPQLGLRADGFRALDSFQASSNKMNRVASIEFGLSGRELTPADQRTVADAAQLSKRAKSEGTFRVIGRSNDASELSQARSTAVARELQRQGISQDRIYVGTDTGPEGRVDVILDK